MSPFLSQGQCWLTLRSTGHFAAHRRWASFHSRPTPVCRKMPVSSNVRHRKSTFVVMPPPMNRPACARLEYTHSAAGRVRSARMQRMCKKMGAYRRRKATVGSPRRAGQRVRQAEEGRHRKAANPVTAKARPPSHGGRAPVLRLHPIGKPNESANCSPGRQGLQGNSVRSHINNAGAHGSRAPGLARSGWVVAKLFTRPPLQIKTALPNSSLNRTLCCGRHLAFISFSAKSQPPQIAG